MTPITFESCTHLKHYLSGCGVVFNEFTWAKPILALWQDHCSGEVQFFEYKDTLCTLEHKVRVQITAERPEGLRFLQETRTYSRWPGRSLPPDESTSVSGKIQFLKGEDPLTRVMTEFREELGIAGVDPAGLQVRYGQRPPDEPRVSRTRPGLYKQVVKHGYRLQLAPEFQRDSYREEATYRLRDEDVVYRISDFAWVPPPKKVLEDLRSAKPSLAA